MKTKKRKKKKKPGKQGDENEEESKVRACAIVHVYIHMYNWSIIVYSIITYWIDVCFFVLISQRSPEHQGDHRVGREKWTIFLRVRRVLYATNQVTARTWSSKSTSSCTSTSQKDVDTCIHTSSSRFFFSKLILICYETDVDVVSCKGILSFCMTRKWPIRWNYRYLYKL